MVEVQVCWRGDLPKAENEDDWADILSVCPPTVAECLPVPLHVFRDWFGSAGQFTDESADVVENESSADAKDRETHRCISVFVWRGPDDCFFLTRGADIRPGDTIILRVQAGGWQMLGHIINSPEDPELINGKTLNPDDVRRVDVADLATLTAKNRGVIRIHPSLWPKPEEETPAFGLWKMAFDHEKDWPIARIKELLHRLVNDENPGWVLTNEQRRVIKHLAESSLYVEPYPEDQGFVLASRDYLRSPDSEETNEADDSDADTLLESIKSQTLSNHTREVLVRVEETVALLPLSGRREALTAAATMHDWGKVDPRFQAMLRGTTPFAVMANDIFLAKSGSIASSVAGRRAGRDRAELPDGFRHEMLSAQMAESAIGLTFLPPDPVSHALTLHLIAVHHGYGRPFAPPVDDDFPPAVKLSMDGKSIDVTSSERLEHPAHALDSGFAERFWQANRRYGWWGLALLETVLRLADQSASACTEGISKL
jgi:CRISPR-associated endonuclease/helicase Cas3